MDSKRRIQQYFRHVIAVRFTGGGNWNTQRRVDHQPVVSHI